MTSVEFGYDPQSLLPLVGELHRETANGKQALITGITGQDGSYLAPLLYLQGYDVTGLLRKHPDSSRSRRTGMHPVDQFPYADFAIGDYAYDAFRIFDQTHPDLIFHLAAQPQVGKSFRTAGADSHATGLGVLNILQAVDHFYEPGEVKVYLAGSSEQFGGVPGTIPDDGYNEQIPFNARSPYGAYKTLAFTLGRIFREQGMFVSNGILFNHESPIRGAEFVTRKITYSVAQIALGMQDVIELGNLDAKRDWGFAGDYVDAMRLMMEQDKPSDYVVATGEMHSIRDLLDIAFQQVGIEDWHNRVVSTDKHRRPVEVEWLKGNASRANSELGWTPRVGFEKLIKSMVAHDLELLS